MFSEKLILNSKDPMLNSSTVPFKTRNRRIKNTKGSLKKKKMQEKEGNLFMIENKKRWNKMKQRKYKNPIGLF